jgi:hypothetical protein
MGGDDCPAKWDYLGQSVLFGHTQKLTSLGVLCNYGRAGAHLSVRPDPSETTLMYRL